MAERVFGHVAGEAGATFNSRSDLANSGIHRPLQAGISGGASEGADSVVVSGGYEDDEDYGDVIVYTGHGGNDPATGKQATAQTLGRQNLALAVSADRGLPIRVVRGAGGNPAYSPRSGYRYDGLYYVESYWKASGRSGHDVWRFRLVGSPEGNPVTNPPPGNPPPQSGQHAYATVQRLIRNTAVTQWVKQLYDHTCQICGTRLVTSSGPYAEGAHIRPVGRPHNGPDSPDNVLCLCPNDHVLFDRGMIGFDGSGNVIELSSGRILGPLAVNPQHGLDAAHAHYHWSLFR